MMHRACNLLYFMVVTSIVFQNIVGFKLCAQDCCLLPPRVRIPSGPCDKAVVCCGMLEDLEFSFYAFFCNNLARL